MTDLSRRTTIGLGLAASAAGLRRARAQTPSDVKIVMLVPLSGPWARQGILEQMGGQVAKVEYWGVKSLTYRIRKNRKAHFTLLNIDGPPAAIAEVERQQHISEDVLRAMTVRVEELEEGPSAMMRKVDRDRDRDERRGERRRDRDDRGPRGPRGDGDEVELTEE